MKKEYDKPNIALVETSADVIASSCESDSAESSKHSYNTEASKQDLYDMIELWR